MYASAMQEECDRTEYKFNRFQVLGTNCVQYLKDLRCRFQILWCRDNRETKLMMNQTEIENYMSDRKYPDPLSFSWRIIHSIAYFLGGITFLVGSYQYFPFINNYVIGGWLFAIGSAGFFCADATEWWINNRVGCFMYENYARSYEAAIEVEADFEDKDTCLGKYQRMENGINFFMSMLGSLLYFIGSIMFIPSLNSISLGTKIFVLGSAVAVIAQSWKIFRAAFNRKRKRNSEDPADKNQNNFRPASCMNWCNDTPGFVIDLLAGLGGFGYFVGSIYFLPRFDLTDEDTVIAASWFTAAGACYVISGLITAYRYFFTLNYPH